MPLKKRYFFVTVLCLTFLAANAQEESIYNGESVSLTNVWKRIADVSPKLRAVEAAELSPNGMYIVSGSKFGYAVMLWDVLDGSLLWKNYHESEVECVTFSPDNKRIATGGEDYLVKIWDVETGELIKDIDNKSGLDGITWSHDGNIIAAGTESGLVNLWDANTFELIKSVKVGSTVNSIQFTKDDTHFIAGGNYQNKEKNSNKVIYTGFAKLVNVASGEVIKDYGDHKASVKSVRISDNGKWVATASFDKSARMFDFESGKLLNQFQEEEKIEAVEFTRDSQFLVTGGHSMTVNFYRTEDYKLATAYPSPRTEYLHFSQDGRLLVTAHEDSGLLELHLFMSDTQNKDGFYHRIASEQLNNKDLKKDKNE
ncbi:WD40 repeat domain-containing protein [Galbibacter sp. BG1]|uniref:WD40 repeat domain-containing protein n=1 Tax=Galbibacter sp. BG1 TaxID=1170699 RepID=UPI0015BE1439|nr:WD40 repeat domain-containing protein [Galbibacter sp. BG1]QLE01624.1 WD40 repeat domain-containing protein [Galbibacter sp. BG1]